MPTLCVKIFTPNDMIIQLLEKIDLYLQAGVAVVWSVDPCDQNVTVYTSNCRPVSYNIDRQIPEHPAMPGFSPMGSELFEV